MRSQYIKDRMREIDIVIKDISSVNDPRVLSYLASFLVVYGCGIYEDCIEYLFVEKARRSNDPDLSNFVSNYLENLFWNPKYKKIKELLGWYSGNYQTKFRGHLKDKSIVGLDSIVENKNILVHTGRFNITLNDFRQFHKSAKKIFGALETTLRI